MVTQTGQERGRQTPTWSGALILPGLMGLLLSLLALCLVPPRN